MTDRELLQMALDMIESPHPGIRTDFSDAMIYREKVKTTIEALRARLAQPVPEPFGWYNAEHDEIITNSWYLEQRKNNPSDDSGFNIPLYTAPPQTKLDPVGYYYRGRFSTEKNAPGIGIYGVPVYTTPPQNDIIDILREQRTLLVEALEQIFDLPEDSRIHYKIARKALAKVTGEEDDI